MNTLKITNEELATKYVDPNTSLSEVFKDLEKELFDLGQVVCRFRVNGLALDEKDEVRLGESKLSDLRELEIDCETPELLLEEIVFNWIQKLPSLIESSDELSQQLRKSGFDGGMKKVVDLIDDCQLLVDSLISIDSLFADSPVVSSKKWKENEDQMATSIGQALKAFEAKDYVLLSDVLEYDLGHSLQSWFESMRELGMELVKKVEEAEKSATGSDERGSEEKNSMDRA